MEDKCPGDYRGMPLAATGDKQNTLTSITGPRQRPRPGRVFWNKIRKGERAPMPLGATGDKQNTLTSYDVRVSYKKVAATYSPTWWGSTIGDGELNFSVRNGKRWILTAITATVCF